MRIGLLLALCVAPAFADPIEIKLVAQPLSSALREFARQSGIQIAIESELIERRMAPALEGKYEPTQVLAVLLEGTGLTAYPINSNTYGIRKVGSDAEQLHGTSYQSTPDSIGPAQNDGFASSLGKQPEAEAGVGSRALQEIVVTAQKVEERLQDVPMALTAVTGEELQRTGAFRFQDFVERVPSLQFVNTSGLTNLLVIRGMSVGDSTITSTVATYIDETPYTAVGSYAGSTQMTPNLDPYDMSRIEVLKGPQGTLYGANALAGLLKYVTNPPDPSRFATSAQVGTNAVEYGGTGYDFHAMTNVPLSSDSALRLVGYYTKYAGYIDDPSRHAANINEIENSGVRGAFVLEPWKGLSIRVNALYQDNRYDDVGYVDGQPYTLDPIYGGHVHETLIGQPGSVRNQLYNATVNWDAGIAKVLWSGSYANYHLYEIVDDTASFGGFASFVLGAPFGVAYPDRTSNRMYTQELRISSTTDRPLFWQLGGFWTRQNAASRVALFPIDLNSGQVLENVPQSLGFFEFTPTYRELAGFGNLDYHLTSTFDVSAGGRYSHNVQHFTQASGGYLGGVPFGTESDQGVFTYSTDARWRFAGDVMVYARVAKGYVPGGPNSVLALDTPTSYKSSTTVNYEAGIKGRWLENQLAYELSAYHINWNAIQLTAVINGQASITNGGTAASDGVEWSLLYSPLAGLDLTLNGSYNKARLTEATPDSVNGHDGDRLPYAPLVQASASIDYRRHLFRGYEWFLGSTWRFNGERYGDFTADGARERMPSYNLLDLRAGLQKDRWRFTALIRNVADARAIGWLYGQVQGEASGQQSVGITQPRTFGASLSVSF